ncbi:MAG: NnrU family protein, partial [Pseudomonadota bacterium]
MTLLTVGVLLWCELHAIPAGMSGPRQSLIDALGEAAYKTGFSVLMLAAVGMMIWGWRGATPSMIYAAPVILRPVAVGLTVLGFVLMAAANHPTRIGRFVRHPQLT